MKLKSVKMKIINVSNILPYLSTSNSYSYEKFCNDLNIQTLVEIHIEYNIAHNMNGINYQIRIFYGYVY